MAVAEKEKSAKKEVKVKCFYNKEGKEAAELIKQSFVLYVKSEAAKEKN